ncbi:Ldh family oxidoreductase [Candidatus Poribacteria bacterium]|nr:Ldh family oxidoreductase [Candidatus Poribacteria bacterium]
MTGEHTRVPAGELAQLTSACFAACDMAGQDAAYLADTLVDADLGGVHSHGVMRVLDYVEKLTTGGVDPRGAPSVVREFGGGVVVDGGNSMGQIGARFAMQRAIALAATHGIAAAAIRGSNHCGAVGYIARMALAEGMIGVATTNALPTMAPWGGAERILGINPLAFAIPAGRERPIEYDAAFSGSSHGKIRIHEQHGLPIPEGWALDRDGNPTTDASVAVDGLLAPIGMYKGTALAMVMGILSSMLSGASYGTELGDMEAGPRPGEDGHFVAAINVAAFEDPHVFAERMDGAIAELHACRVADGHERVYAPGEIEALRREEYGADGIPLNAVTLAELATVARGLGVSSADVPWLPNV